MQKAVETFILRHELCCGVRNRFIDLTSEIGELGKELLKGSCYGKQAYEHSDNVLSEMGDCLFSLLALCSEMGFSAEEALQNALQKYENRFDETGEISSRNG